MSLASTITIQQSLKPFVIFYVSNSHLSIVKFKFHLSELLFKSKIDITNFQFKKSLTT